jgi:hypothetical protein
MHRRLSRVGRGCGVAGKGLLRCPTEGSRPVPLTISRAQRDAIYEMVVNHLTAIGGTHTQRGTQSTTSTLPAGRARLPGARSGRCRCRGLETMREARRLV